MNSFPFFRFPYDNYYRYYNYRNNLNKNNLNKNINSLICNTENSSTTCPPYKYNKNYENYVKPNTNCTDKSSKIVNNTCQKANYKNNSDFKNNNCENNNDRLAKNKSSKFHLGPIVFDSSSFSDFEKPVLELLGLKLYLDDLLIISLLYFLYEEDVKDETLFISLLLLLLS